MKTSQTNQEEPANIFEAWQWPKRPSKGRIDYPKFKTVELRADIVDTIDEACKATGRTRDQVVNEAVWLMIRKCVEKLPQGV